MIEYAVWSFGMILLLLLGAFVLTLLVAVASHIFGFDLTPTDGPSAEPAGQPIETLGRSRLQARKS